MDIAYIIGPGSKWDDNELRYSLRSIDRYGLGIDNIWIIGYCPDFIDQTKVNYIPMQDRPGRAPAQNVFFKIRYLMESPITPDKIIISSDDHFFIRQVDFDHWPIFFKGFEMPTHASVGSGKFGDRRYTQCMADTRDIMDQLGLGTVYFEGHTNKLYDKRAWSWLKKRHAFDLILTCSAGLSTNSLMGATMTKVFGYTPIHRTDVKLRDKDLQQHAIRQLLKDTDEFSIYDSAIDAGIDTYLKDLFPDPSRWEKKV